MKVEVGDIKSKNKLMMYKNYAQILKPILGGNIGARSIDVIAAILFYTNKIYKEHNSLDSLRKELGTLKAKEAIRNLVTTIHADDKKPYSYSIEEEYFKVIISDLRKRGFIYDEAGGGLREKTVMLKSAKIFNVALSDDEEIDFTIKVSTNGRDN